MSDFTREQIETVYRVFAAQRADPDKLVFTDYWDDRTRQEKPA